MIVSMFKGAGRIALWLATMLFLAGLSLFIFGSYILTWPILRLSPRDQRVKVLMDMAASAFSAMTVFGRQLQDNLTDMGEQIDTGGDDNGHA